MRFKTVHVLDEMTDCYFLVGKPEVSDLKMLTSTGWNLVPHLQPTLLIWIKVGGGIEGAMSSFNGDIAYDLGVYGPLEYSGTTHKLAQVMRNLNFDEIPDEVNLEEVSIWTQ